MLGNSFCFALLSFPLTDWPSLSVCCASLSLSLSTPFNASLPSLTFSFCNRESLYSLSVHSLSLSLYLSFPLSFCLLSPVSLQQPLSPLQTHTQAQAGAVHTQTLLHSCIQAHGGGSSSSSTRRRMEQDREWVGGGGSSSRSSSSMRGGS